MRIAALSDEMFSHEVMAFKTEQPRANKLPKMVKTLKHTNNTMFNELRCKLYGTKLASQWHAEARHKFEKSKVPFLNELVILYKDSDVKVLKEVICQDAYSAGVRGKAKKHFNI